MIKVSQKQIEKWMYDLNLSVDMVQMILKEYNFTDSDGKGNLIFVPNIKKDLEIFMGELYDALHFEGHELNHNAVLRYTEHLREIDDELEDEYNEKHREVGKFVVKLFKNQHYLDEDGEVLSTHCSKYRKLYDQYEDLPAFDKTFLAAFQDYTSEQYDVKDYLTAFNLCASLRDGEDVSLLFVKIFIDLSKI